MPHAMITAALARYTAAPGQVASFLAARRGDLTFLLPLSTTAAAWLRSHAGREGTWSGDELALDKWQFGDFAEAIAEAGFLFDRDTFPN